MAKFKYYIVDADAGQVTGTDDGDRAEYFADSDDHFVVNAQTGEWLAYSHSTVQVEENAQELGDPDEEEEG